MNQVPGKVTKLNYLHICKNFVIRSSQLEIENISNPSSDYEISGRRIVDIKLIFESITSFKHLELFKCGACHLRIVKELRIGLISKFTLQCSMCKEVAIVSTDKIEPNHMDINKATVLGTISTGGGHSQLEELLAFCDIPCMSFRTFSHCQSDVASHIYETAHDLMLLAGKEEAQLATDAGDIDNDGIPKITVIADGAWCKRSYKTNYNASSGVVSTYNLSQKTRNISFQFFIRELSLVNVPKKFFIWASKINTASYVLGQRRCHRNQRHTIVLRIGLGRLHLWSQK